MEYKLKDIKFTTDGKKVVVLGSLNSQEKIVQEIFVIDGSEIPSGEHFVVKSLHDSPAVSWKQQELEKLEKQYESLKSRYSKEIVDLEKSYNQRRKELRARLEYAGLALKNASEESFKTLVDYITGEIQWVVVKHYDIQILPINEFNQMYEDKLRLISIFGTDNGTFTYAIGDYYDLSGGNKKFIPFKTYEDALSCFKQLILESPVSEKNIEIAEKFGFALHKEKVEEWKKKQTEELSRNIAKYEDSIKAWKESIEKYQAD